MPTLNIKDPVVYQMASQLAGQWETTRTGAIRRALSDALNESSLARENQRLQCEAILSEIRSNFIPGVDMAAIADDLYDEAGLPK